MGLGPPHTDRESRGMRLPLVSVTLISAAALAYEILLTRLFSIIQWHHFAYMIISLALLGFGASGSFIAIFQKRLLDRFAFHYPLNLSLFGLTSLFCFLLAQRIPLNPEEMLWAPRQFGRLTAVYFLLSVPFFFAANGLGLALARFRGGIPRVYAADLLGAGLGSICVLLLLFLVFPGPALQIIAAAGLVAGAVASIELATRPRVVALALGIAAALPLAVPEAWLALQLSPYKSLPQTLRVPGAHVIAERSSPLGLISVVESPEAPLRHAPGLSVRAPTGPPEQLGLFTDGDSLTVVNRYEGRDLAYLGQSTSAAPFYMASPQTVLVLGAGGGVDVLQALQLGAERVDAVELNRQIIDLVKNEYGDFSGRLYSRPEVHTHAAEARGFIAGAGRRYDLIALPLLDSLGAASAGLYALNESYLYTVESFAELLSRLAPGGYLAVTRWVKNPPRDALKLFATAVVALENAGIREPGMRLALIRGWQTTTLLVKNGPITSDEISALRNFCDARSFDTAYYPGIRKTDANRYNVLSEPFYYAGALALLGEDREAFFERYKFDLRPATDGRPYFFHFFKWSVLPEILRLRGGGGLPLLESGYLILIVTFAQAAVLSLLLILLPLALLPRNGLQASGGFNGKVLTYFLALGLGFLLLEMAFIQRFVLFLHHPVYSVAVVLSGFLVFAGLGSALSRLFGRRIGEAAAVRTAVLLIIILGIAYAAALGPLFGLLASMAVWAKIITVWAIIAPLAFFMGVPFPTGLSSLAAIAPALIPWAWAINGCASVLSAVLGTVLAVHLGFGWVVALALVTYGVAALTFGRAGKFGNPP